MIAYVLDEYPSVSQTFVHNEIIELRRQGIAVLPIAMQGAQGDRDLHGTSLQLRGWGESLPALARYLVTSPRQTLSMLSHLASLRGEHSRLALTALPLVADQLRKQGVTHVHAHFAWGAAAVGGCLAKLLGVPFSLTVHARDLYVDGKHLRAKLSAADTIVTVCEFNRSILGESGADPGRITLVRCGVSIPDQSAAQSMERGIDVIVVGRFVPKKGYAVLVAALSRLRDSGVIVRCAMVGDGPERAAIEEQVKVKGLAESVIFYGSLPHDQTLELIADSRVLCMPAVVAPDGDSDALPVVIYEAMARGVAVVASSVAGIPEMVDEETGWLVKPSDHVALSEALRAALSDPAEASRRAAAARSRVSRDACLRIEVQKLRASVLSV